MSASDSGQDPARDPQAQFALHRTGACTRRSVQQMIDGTVADVVEAFRTTIGLWPDHRR
jgi:hypothetical protein